MKFDWTITLDAIVTAVVALVAIGGAWTSISVRLARIETKMKPIWDWWNAPNGEDMTRSTFDAKVEHAVRGAVVSAVVEVLRQDRIARS